MTPPQPNPFDDDAMPRAAGLSPMEMMGVLTVRLIHDLSNQLTILAGNAQVLELVRDNPERLAKVIDRLKNAASNAGELLDRFAQFRQALRFRTGPYPLTDFVHCIATMNPRPAGWSIDTSGELAGALALEPRWVAFAVWQVALQCGSASGCIDLRGGEFPTDWRASAHVPSRLREKRLLHCELNWSGPGPWISDAESAKPSDLRLATVYEILKILDGWAHYEFLDRETHRFHLFFPLST